MENENAEEEKEEAGKRDYSDEIGKLAAVGLCAVIAGFVGARILFDSEIKRAQSCILTKEHLKSEVEKNKQNPYVAFTMCVGFPSGVPK